ncbi:MAG: ABC transporter permease [Clostridia bacterium]|nr:ABC transporter permease [Clostridia bacterium]MBQ5893047.1 ABC transporter permease [Clostridia bacterium]
MQTLLATAEVFLRSGFVFSLIAMGYYISYTLLDFPDLTVEGTFLSGAAVFAILIHHGVNAWIALVASFLVGFLFGTLTGILHVKLRIRPLLCGILVSTALLTVNLIAVSAGMTGDFSGESTSQISYGRGAATLDNVFPINLIPPRIPGLNLALRELILFALLAILFKFLLDWFLSTKRGMLLRATGSNDRFVTTLAKDCGNSKILGLGIGNAYAAVAGALYTHISGNVNQSMGTGTIVIGLASLIIGLSVFKRVRFLRPSTKVILGALLYQLCLTVAQKMGVPSAYNKLIMAVLFTGALLLSRRGRAAKQAAAGRE